MRDRTEFAPLQPARGAVPAPASRYGWGGPGSLLALPGGSIASDLHAIAVDRSRAIATYELLVANETISPVATFAYAVGNVATSMMSWSTITVPPFASVAVTLDVPLPRDRRKQRVVVELHAEDAHLTLDAESPILPKRLFPNRTSLAVAVIAPVLAICAIAYALMQPRVVALGAPKSVVAGRPFSIAYVLGGVGGGEYEVETPQGFQVRRGALDRRVGALSLTLPANPDLRSYDLRLSVANRLGSDARIVRITAAPPPATPPPVPLAASGGRLVPDVALSSDTVTSGQAVGVAYPLGSGSATALLVDQAGKTRGSALFDGSGHTMLVAPPVAVDEPFRVVVRVREGNSSVESSAPLVVKAASKTEDNAPAPLDGSQPPRGIAVEGDLPFAVATPAVRGGELLRLAIVQHEAGLRIALTSVAGSEVSAADVSPGQDSVGLRTPAVSRPTEYLVVATFRHGVSQETVVRPITIQP